MKVLRLIFNILFGLGAFAVFNESESFGPNFFGLACFGLLIVGNMAYDAWEQTHKEKK